MRQNIRTHSYHRALWIRAWIVVVGLIALAAPSTSPSALAIAIAAPAAQPAAVTRPPAVSDSLYRAHHPRLLFTSAEVPALIDKVRDGGYDDRAYRQIRTLVDSVYPLETELKMIDHDVGIATIPNIGLAAHLEHPVDDTAMALGRRLTTFIADNFAPDDNPFWSPLRLRSLCMGYDMFFGSATPAQRGEIRDEIETYVDSIMTAFNYERWLVRPYLSNISTVTGAALGLAAICLDGEMDAAKVEAALELADTYVDTWARYLLDPDGAYNEGAMYAGFSMRNLAYYFWARKRYDGYDYAQREEFRNIEKWIAFAVLPDGGAKINNINDASYLNFPLSRHNTYFDWAQTEWSSHLSAWLWERFVGPVYGHDSGRLADKPATVLWNRNLAPQQPDDVLGQHAIWLHRGLYYFRTGWQRSARSDDVLFSFYSGKFQGGHAHVDQNNFTLYGYGGRFAIDNGFGSHAIGSYAHNMVFIDRKGQHAAGALVGTDGRIAEYLLSEYADYIFGDATAAYNIYSEFNRPGHPFPDSDWSGLYGTGNPVIHAHRRVILVHDPDTPPYLVVCYTSNDGYSFLSLIRASSVVNRQSIVASSALRFLSHADTSRRSAC